MTSFASPLFWQIQYLVTNFNKKNFKSSVAELNQLVDLYGDDARIFLLNCLVKGIDFRDNKASHHKDSLKIQLLAHEIAQASSRPNFTTFLCEAFEGLAHGRIINGNGVNSKQVLTDDWLMNVCKLLKLNVPQQVTIALAVLQGNSPEDGAGALQFLRSTVLELANCGAKLPPDVLHSLISLLRTHVAFQKDAEDTDVLLASIAAPHPRDMHTAEISPLTELDLDCVNCTLPTNNECISKLASELEAGCLCYELMEDVGYACTSTEKAFRALLGEASVADTTMLTPHELAGMLVMLSRTFSGMSEDNGATLMAQLSSVCDSPNVKENADDNYERKTWNLDVIAAVLQKDCDLLKWIKVAEEFDRAELDIRNPIQLRYLINAYQKCSQTRFQVSTILRPWKHQRAQLGVLKAAIELPPEVLSFAESPRKLAPFEGADAAAVPKNGAWFSLDLVDTLLSISEKDCYGKVRHIFDGPMKMCPDVLIANLAESKMKSSNLRDDIFSELLGIYIMGRPNAPLIMRHLWSVVPNFILHASVKCYYATTSAQIISRLFTLYRTTEDAFSHAIHSNYYTFALALAIVGSNHDVLNIETWMTERLTSQRVPFVTSCLAFVHRNYTRAVPKKSITPSTSHLMSIEALTAILKLIVGVQSILPPPIAQELKRVITLSIEIHPIIAAGTKPRADTIKEATETASMEANVTPEMIEEQANAYFQQIYTSEQNINDVVAMLKRFQTSRDERERQIFFCMIHNLFDEYRFFPRYPEMELRITGVLFGKLIEHQVLPSNFLQTALRSVLESLREPVNSKYFFFGACALQQFVPRLRELPAYCTNLSQIPHLVHALPEIMRHVVRSVGIRSEGDASERSPGDVSSEDTSKVVRQMETVTTTTVTTVKIATPSNATQSSREETVEVRSQVIVSQPSVSPKLIASPASPQLPPMIVNHIFNEESVSDESEVLAQPDEGIKDRIHFIVNNMSISNLEAKIPEMRKILIENFYPWMANYLVIKRISTQPNYHTVYLIFIEKLMQPELEKEIMRRTLINARKLITSASITTNSQQRSLLKNLGLWLGLFTLSRNKPLLQRELDLKELLYVGYETGHLIAVAPFVAKVLEGCKKSKIFKPPNPWIMGLIHAMREIYDVPDLKLNLKFEIEVLFKSFRLSVEEQCKAGLLDSRLTPPRPGNPDFNVKTSKSLRSVTPTPSQKLVHKQALTGSTTPSKIVKSSKLDGASPAANRDTANGAFASPHNSTVSESTVIPNLASYVAVNPDLPLSNVNLKRLLPLAVDRAIREVISPVVERSVTIACITTREIILKDFATECDDVKMRKAAHLMVASMSGSLALITAKEPLRSSIGSHLRALIPSSVGEPQQIEHVIQVCSNENTDLGCMLIEKASSEKAMRDIDEALSAVYASRRRYNQQRQGKVSDTVHYFHGSAQQSSVSLPATFRPKPGGIPPSMLVVYEAFQRIPRPTSMSITRAGYAPTSSLGAGAVPRNESKDQSPNQEVAAFTAAAALERVGGLVEKAELFVQNVVRQSGNGQREMPSLHSIPAESEIFNVIREFRSIVNSVKPPFREEATLKIAQQIVKCMYELGSGRSDELFLEILASSLYALCTNADKVKKEIVAWVVRMSVEDKLKLHSDIILALVRFKVLELSEFDAYLTRNMERNSVAIEFAVHIIRQCLTMDHVKLSTQLPGTLDALSRIVERHANPTNRNLQILSSLIEQAKSNDSTTRSAKIGGGVTKMPNEIGGGGKTVDRSSAQQLAACKYTITNAIEHWIAIYKQATSNQKVHAQFIQMLRQSGLLNDDESISLFFNYSLELCVDACIKSSYSSDLTALRNGVKLPLNYVIIDALTHLMALLVKYLDSSITVKVQILNHAVRAIANVLVVAHELSRKKKTIFDQRIFFRLFLNLMKELTLREPVLETIHLQVLNTFASAYNTLQPLALPGFVFAWMELISHRCFMPLLLEARQQRGWQILHRLVVNLLQFLEVFVRHADVQPLSASMVELYKGTLRIMLVLWHDFPEFLCEFYMSFCDVIPASCIQLRNIILSASPRDVCLPDPRVPFLQALQLSHVSAAPRLTQTFAAALAHNGLKEYLDGILQSIRDVSVPQELITKLLVPPAQLVRDPNACKYSIPTINAVIVYIGKESTATPSIGDCDDNKQDPMIKLEKMAAMKIYRFLAEELDAEGRYYFLNCLANHLRYPNSQTQFYSWIILYLFSSTASKTLKEQITRVLIERLVANRPHPWGLVITFVELIRNKSYTFWKQEYLESTNEIKEVLDDVARTCLGTLESVKSVA
ncbi:unnamed protein product [Albugo candida]|uniref:CCR4-NOT transcription complex subunit 1 n=1 Tax=Albugo candida TaxID=65357 RepID=A0A024GTE8_9STRA|nr:unnamed protein product [Albugo candida]|eukprot:CCI49970.1 unnamed protein product [Albugo candida]